MWCRLSRRMKQDGGLVEPLLSQPLREGLAVDCIFVSPDKSEVVMVVANVMEREGLIPKEIVVGSCEVCALY